MKQPKTFLLLSVIVAVLVLGVAYASITANLDITASATVAPDGSNFNVEFTNAEVTTVSNGASKDLVEATIKTDARKADLTINTGALSELGDTVVATYTVTNKSQDLIANLANINITNEVNSQYVKFTAKYGANGQTLAAKNGATTVIVTAELVKSPIDSITASATIAFTTTAEEANS